MAAKKNTREIIPALTPEARENQLISLAMDTTEKRIRENTASSQELIHFLRLGTTRERLEQERLQRENLLLSAKVDQLESSKRVEQLFEEAISAFRTYSGQEDMETYDR